jgi:hypothetical protein
MSVYNIHLSHQAVLHGLFGGVHMDVWWCSIEMWCVARTVVWGGGQLPAWC